MPIDASLDEWLAEVGRVAITAGRLENELQLLLESLTANRNKKYTPVSRVIDRLQALASSPDFMHPFADELRDWLPTLQPWLNERNAIVHANWDMHSTDERGRPVFSGINGGNTFDDIKQVIALSMRLLNASIACEDLRLRWPKYREDGDHWYAQQWWRVAMPPE